MFLTFLVDQFKEMNSTEVMTTMTGNPFSALYPQTNRLTMDNLDRLVHLSAEGPPLQDFDFEAATTKWANMSNRKLNNIYETTLFEIHAGRNTVMGLNMSEWFIK